MFESTLEAQALNEGERRFGTLSAAALVHLVFGLTVIAATAIIASPVRTPDPPPVLVFIPGIPAAEPTPRSTPPAPPKKGREEPARDAVVPPPRVTPEAPPVTTPETPLLPSTEGASPRDGDGTQGDSKGSPFGIDGGVDDGRAGGGDSGAPGPIEISGDMVRPVLVVKVEPSYPHVARRAGLGGRVTLRAVIAEDGSVESVEVFASTNPLFDDAAVDAVRQWRYRPALMNGRPVKVYFSVVVNFLLR